MSINTYNLRDLITEVLTEVNLYSDSALELLMLTAATESQLGTYLKQRNGPALGIFQMEPATHDDIWANFIRYKPGIAADIAPYRNRIRTGPNSRDLQHNLGYAIIMTRVHYLRVKEPLPAADDIKGLAKYWKKYYNTSKGKGTIDEAIVKYTYYAA